ncbi:MAG: MoxR family ATPase [Lachnospiraceae bacterium]|nr:MoxR family ATPase [Lachnospiraceae bacterium]
MNLNEKNTNLKIAQPDVQLTLEELRDRLTAQNYIVDEELLVTLFVSLKLGRPLLIEGEAGVGKTEVAKAMAAALGRELVRLQCYEGLDESKALYEWNYQKQLLAIQVNMNQERAVGAGSCEGRKSSDEMTAELFSENYLLERPLLKSIRSEEPVVLLIDEIDKSDEEFEAFLLELLSEMQVTIPELGTVKAQSMPFVVLTSNHVRPLSAALRRRCAYLYIDYPSVEKEVNIITSRLPEIENQLARQVAETVRQIRQNERLTRKPSIAEAIDWAAALMALGVKKIDRKGLTDTMGFLLKNNQDMDAVLQDDEIIDEKPGRRSAK